MQDTCIDYIKYHVQKQYMYFDLYYGCDPV